MKSDNWKLLSQDLVELQSGVNSNAATNFVVNLLDRCAVGGGGCPVVYGQSKRAAYDTVLWLKSGNGVDLDTELKAVGGSVKKLWDVYLRDVVEQKRGLVDLIVLATEIVDSVDSWQDSDRHDSILTAMDLEYKLGKFGFSGVGFELDKIFEPLD